MNADVSEWLNLIIRWIHVFAGILWIGQTYYFTWLDARFEEALASTSTSTSTSRSTGGGGGQVWMVHSGGFYVVEKQQVPELLPRKLHWFRWEAAFTWMSGILLLLLIYPLGGALTDENVAHVSTSAATAVGLGALVVGWFVYDLLWQSPLGKREPVATAVSYLLLIAIAYGLMRVLSSRAAYIHAGALLGTIMAANVWLRILPAQRQMLAATRAGEAPDPGLAARAKQRSKHNTFMVVPVVFTMISNHFPTATYGNEHNWLVLAILLLVGAGAAKLLRGRP